MSDPFPPPPGEDDGAEQVTAPGPTASSPLRPPAPPQAETPAADPVPPEQPSVAPGWPAADVRSEQPAEAFDVSAPPAPTSATADVPPAAHGWPTTGAPPAPSAAEPDAHELTPAMAAPVVPPEGRAEPEGQRTPLVSALAAGLLTALFGGLVWGLVADSTDSGLPGAAVPLGLAVGFAIHVVARGRTANLGELSVVAAVCTLVGLVVGKYLVFALVLSDAVQFPGVPVPSAFSTEMVRLFVDHVDVAFQRIDLVWAVAAVSAALFPLAIGDGGEVDEAPPKHQAHNPVDRLTRGLPHNVRVAVDWMVTIVGAVAIVLLVKAFVVNPYRIPSSSMEPTLHCAVPGSGCEARYSDRVLANRFLYHLRDPRRGDIVVFDTPAAAQAKCGAGGTFVKRLVGLPGETIEVRLKNGDGYVYINGRQLREPYIGPERRASVDSYGPFKIPPGQYFMMGDNRAQSCDSRAWGAVPRDNLIGKVFATYWPPNRLSLH